MAHLYPAVYLVWALLSTMLGSFLLFHLWSFDRFQCIKWNHGPHSGAFKRIMTYSYLLSIPLIMVYSIGFTVIKYTYGFRLIAVQGAIVPTPFAFWSKTAQSAVFPLYLSVSLAWSFEMVTHLEELCFWLFLVNSSTKQQDWFRSPYFKTWAVGSCIAVLAMPLITIFTRENVYKCEAYTFLAGGLGSFTLTISFLPVLINFPRFIQNLRDLDVDPGTLLRLATYQELNHIRVIFRFLFTVPLIILGVDGVRTHQHVNNNMFASDFLAIIAGIGCVISSAITLIIFFPRSLKGEMALKEQRRKQQTLSQDSQSMIISPTALGCDEHSYSSVAHAKRDSWDASLSVNGLPTYDVAVTREQSSLSASTEEVQVDEEIGSASSLRPNRRNETGDIELGGVLSSREAVLVRARSKRNVNELVYSWRSPLEIGRPTAVSLRQRPS